MGPTCPATFLQDFEKILLRLPGSDVESGCSAGWDLGEGATPQVSTAELFWRPHFTLHRRRHTPPTERAVVRGRVAHLQLRALDPRPAAVVALHGRVEDAAG